jgi:imidazolonepropionase-like amidohydrolase
MQPPVRQTPARFVDAHVHFAGPQGLEEVVSAGIGAVRNAGMPACIEPASSGRVGGSGRLTIITSCRAIHKRGGYGGRFGVAVGTKSEITAELRSLKSAGADIIKVMASGIVSLKNPGTVTAGGFDHDQLRFIVDEAGALGLSVMAHANGEAVTAAAEAGVRSVEHGFFMTERALAIMAERQIFWVPTMGALVRAAEKNEAAPAAREFIRKLVDSHLAMIRRAYETGVSLAVGTDCVLPDPGYERAYCAELSLFERAGIPRDAVVAIACEGGARLLGLIDSARST